jgi:hypothetical protein
MQEADTVPDPRCRNLGGLLGIGVIVLYEVGEIPIPVIDAKLLEDIVKRLVSRTNEIGVGLDLFGPRVPANNQDISFPWTAARQPLKVSWHCGYIDELIRRLGEHTISRLSVKDSSRELCEP